MSERSSLRGDRGIPNAEMDRRVKALAARAGIGGTLTVRHVTPTLPVSEQDAAAVAVLAAMRSSGRPAAAGFLAHVTGLSRPTVSNALRALADAGRVVEAGTSLQTKGRRQRLWAIAEAT